MANSMYRNDYEHFFHEKMKYRILADPEQEAYVKAILAPTNDVQAVFCNAAAGTGKTAIALSAAYYQMHKGNADRIIYVRNAMSVRTTGFLPGTLGEKEAPFMQPAIDVINRIGYKVEKNMDLFADMTESGHLICTTTSYLRGVDFDAKTILIVDEAQNLDLTELQTVLTRAHDTVKVIVVGSSLQNDNPRVEKYGANKTMLPFELYIDHFMNQSEIPVENISLSRNYRGKFANFADKIQESVTRVNVKPEPTDPSFEKPFYPKKGCFKNPEQAKSEHLNEEFLKTIYGTEIPFYTTNDKGNYIGI